MRYQVWSPPISHLRYVDDLLPFVKASIEHARCVLHCFDLFCQTSEKKINRQKTHVYYSTNVTNYEGTLFSMHVLAKLIVSPLKWIVRIIWLSYEGNFFFLRS
jgi:hypothetical protein